MTHNAWILINLFSKLQLLPRLVLDFKAFIHAGNVLLDLVASVGFDVIIMNEIQAIIRNVSIQFLFRRIWGRLWYHLLWSVYLLYPITFLFLISCVLLHPSTRSLIIFRDGRILIHLRYGCLSFIISIRIGHLQLLIIWAKINIIDQ